MKILDYPRIDRLETNNVYLVDGAAGTKTINAIEAVLAALHAISPENHKRVFRGKSLGSEVTYEQLVAIQNGTFEGIWLGDYWEANGYKWRVVDFDYWKGTGDNTFVNHHLVIMPDTYLYTAKMNPTAVVTGAYVGSDMYKNGLANAKTIIKNAFPDSLLTHRSFFNDSVSGDNAITGDWHDSQIDLPNEAMVFGSYIHAGCGPEAKRYTADKTQLALFQLSPQFLVNDKAWWLRDVASSSMFAAIGYYGTAKTEKANADNIGVRPVFAIG